MLMYVCKFQRLIYPEVSYLHNIKIHIMEHRRLFIIFGLILFLSQGIAQKPDLYMPLNFKKAYTGGTRSYDGKPGKHYWQNRADYAMNITVEPVSQILSGKEEITYYNNSPDTLNVLVVHLYPNIFRKGAVRDYPADPADLTDGVDIEMIRVNGKEIDLSPHKRKVRIQNTLLYVLPNDPVSPESETEIAVEWNFSMNSNSHLRTGKVDSSTFFVAYFYPRLAVYDDIDDWNTANYTGQKEFYHDFGNYDVTVNVPPNYLIWATGELQNADDVLEEEYLERFLRAKQSDEIIHIIDADDADRMKITSGKKPNSWNYKADNVTDFAFATSDHYLWDASGMVVDRETGRRTLIQTAYDRNSDDFYQVCKLARKAVYYMSNQFPGIPFPYPSITVFNGLSEMEYPMMVNDYSVENYAFLIELTSHEIFHTYFPFYTGLNETKYAWMDEGLTVLGEYLIASYIDTTEQKEIFMASSYQQNMGNDWEMPLFSNSLNIRSITYFFNSYPKAGTFFYILRDLLGEDLFNQAIQQFIHRWNGKHPTPYDLFFTIEDIARTDLSWFVKPWFFEFGYPDLAIKDVRDKEHAVIVTIEKKGIYPVPVALTIEYIDGSSLNVHRTAEVWKDGRTILNVEIENFSGIKKILLGNHLVLDANNSDNVWMKE